MMKKSLHIILLSVALSVGLVSCSQDGLVRINERPLNSPVLVSNDLPVAGAANPASAPSLLDQLGNPNTIGSTAPTPGLTPPAVLTPGTVAPIAPTNPSAPAISGLENLIKPPVPTPPVQNPQAQPPVAANLPIASPVPGDRTVVFSPYSPGKKVSIKKKDGTPYASGTKMRDPYSPGGQGMFRIP